MKSTQRRNEYIRIKMLQLDKVTDAHRHTRRLARIMKYCELLFIIEKAYHLKKLRKVFK